jgi:hypothetical protein
MLKAIKSNSKFFYQVGDESAFDLDLSLAAFTDIRALLPKLSTPYGFGTEFFLHEPNKMINKTLLTHKNFMIVLTAICSKKPQQNDCALRLLGPGQEIYLKKMAEFLGVPTGEELQLLRRARKNLDIMGYH